MSDVASSNSRPSDAGSGGTSSGGGRITAREHAHALVNKYAIGSGAGSLLPIPGLWAAITVVETKLLSEIAEAYGEKLERTDLAKLAALLGAKNMGVRILGDAALALPLIGTFARVVLFGGSLREFGKAAIRYFEAKHPGALLGDAAS